MNSLLRYKSRLLSSCYKPTALIKLSTLSPSVSAPLAPSDKTTVLLKKLPPSITQTSLVASLQAIPHRKSELQPGFVLHVKNPAAAEVVSNIVKEQFNCDTRIGHASLPSLLLQNIPNDVTVYSLMDNFREFKPASIHISGNSSLQISVDNASDSLVVSEIIESIKLHDQPLKANIVELDKQNYVISVSNLHHKSSWKDVEAALKSAIPVDILPKTKIAHSDDQGKTLQLRLKSSRNINKVKAALTNLKLKGGNLVVSEPYPLLHPALFIRNISHLTEAVLRPLVSGYNPRRINFSYRTELVLDDMMVVYFETEQEALHAYKALKNITLDSHRLSVSYKEVAELELVMRNVPSSVADSDIKESLKNIAVDNYKTEHLPGDKTHRNIRILLANQRALDQSMLVLKGYDVAIDKDGASSYVGLTVEVPPNVDMDDASILSTISSCVPDIDPTIISKSIMMHSNRQAFVSFLNYQTAMNAQKAFTADKIKVASTSSDKLSTLIHSKLSAYPSYAIEVSDLDLETSIESVIDGIKNPQKIDLDRYFLSADRMAIVKFKRHMHVIPGMKQLRGLEIDGQKIAVERYRSTVMEPDTEYDLDAAEEEFDRVTLRALLNDNLQAEPATRYQLAKNLFERTLTDIESGSTIADKAAYLLSESSPPILKKEAGKLLNQRKLSEADRKRLFEIFLQRDDMYSFLVDFQDFVAAFGKPDDSDPNDWSQFEIFQDKDVLRLQAAMKRRENELDANPEAYKEGIEESSIEEYVDKTETMQVEENQPRSRFSLSDDEDDDFPKKESFREDFIVIPGKNGEDDEKVSLLDPDTLTDRDGRPWSGVILDTDTTQKTLPGNRVMSHRALVMIGNLRGAGGFGIGKGATVDKAIEGAFRDALRNLIFIDLYENSSFAHDLYGKHNACHVYIRATQKSRVFVGSVMAEEILTRMGVSSASVKVAGRRNPYSVTRAIFAALSTHENLDEYAKQRGQRYLTLKWAYKNNT